MTWTKVLLVMWAAIASLSIGRKAVPTDFWFDVTFVEVSDAQVNSCPVLNVDRHINKTFEGDWYVTLFRVNERGEKEFYRRFPDTGRYDNIYYTGVSLPDPLWFWWWVRFPEDSGGQLCSHLFSTEGDYVMETVWTLYLDTYGERKVKVESNVFTIYPTELDNANGL